MNARLRARLALLATAALLLPAVPAAAARVVQVRVGEHPEFTRVVFELDAPAGYRVERKAGSAELVVTLDAASGARKYSRKSSDIRAVEVEAAERAVARVRLSNPKLQLKEMILSNPPRIVLDVLREKPVVAVAKPAPKPAAETKPVAETKPAAETKTATAPKPAAEAKPVPAPKPAPEAKPIAKPEPAQAPKPIAKAEPAPTPKPAPEAKPAPATKPLAEAKPPAPTPPPAIPAKPPTPAPTPVAETKPSAPKPAAELKPPALPEKPAEKLAEAPKPVAELKPPAPKAEAPAPVTQLAEAPKPAAPPVPTPPSAKPVMTADDLAKLVAAKSAEQADETAAAKPAAPTTPPGATTTPAPTTPALPTPPPGAVVEVAKPLPAPAPAKPVPAPAKTTPAAKPTAEPKATASSSWLSNPIVLGAAAGVLLCVVGLVLLLRRRRALPNDLDVTAIAEEHGDAEADGGMHAGTGSTDDDAFSLFDGDESSTAQEPATAPVSRSAAPAPAPDSNEDSEASFASLFDDDEESHGPTVTQGATMNQPTTSDFPMDRPAADRTAATVATPRSASAVPGADVVRLVQDLERRMSLLEKKLGESNEAREKLERQVAAQSEELRVQRAAIARTQRALRTMTRGEEDKATEPALREDPSGQTQSKTRINL